MSQPPQDRLLPFEARLGQRLPRTCQGYVTFYYYFLSGVSEEFTAGPRLRCAPSGPGSQGGGRLFFCFFFGWPLPLLVLLGLLVLLVLSFVFPFLLLRLLLLWAQLWEPECLELLAGTTLFCRPVP